MAINISARNARIYIGEKDFSSCFVSFQGSDSHLDQNGIITFTGSIVLGLSLGFDESLDDRKNPRFFRGQTITVEVQNSQGNLAKHPRGALRIISPKYDEQSQRLTIDVGDLTALLNFREPTDVAVTQITLGQSSTSGDIILRLLRAAGIVAIGGGLPTTTINYPINLTGSYLANVGKLLYANNMFGWIDKNEVFQISSAWIGAVSAAVTINIGKDEISYKRLDAAEAPCEIIKATGRGVIVSPVVFRDDTSENYGAGTLVDKTALPTPVIIKQTSIKEEWISAQNLLQTTTTTLQPIGLVVPKALLTSSTLTLSLIPSEIRIDKIYYEEDPEGKIKNKVSTIYQLLAPAILEFAQANKNFTFNSFGLSNPIDSSYSYSYDSKGRQSQVVTTTKVIAGSLLSNTSEDWTKWTSPPDFAADSEYKVETWNETSKGIWEYEFYSYQPVVKVTPDSVVVAKNSGTAGPTSNKLDLIYADGDYQSSNSGQLAPPAPERRPALFTMQEEDLVHQVTFVVPGNSNSNLRPRQRSFSVDFLAGQLKPGLAKGEVEISSSSNTQANNQLLAIALREGRLLLGRYKGQQIAVSLSDAWFDYHPLMSISAIESDGTEQAFLADGCSWVVGQTRTLVSCDAIWLGSWQTPTPLAGQPSVSYVAPPYDEVQILSFGNGIGIAFNGFPYAVTATTETSGLGLGINCGMWVGTEISPLSWGNLNWDSITAWDSIPNDSIAWDSIAWDSIDWENL